MKWFKYGVIAMLGFSISACDMNAKSSGYDEVTVAQVQQLITKNDAPIWVLDVRTQGEYASGHVPTAHNISIDSLSSRLQEVPRDIDVYVYCESGVRSTRAAEFLVASGYSKVHNMRASMRGWRSADYTIEK